MKTSFRLFLATLLLSLSLSAHADSYNVCIGIKNLCKEGVNLFTEPLSIDRINGHLSCRDMKVDCNDLLTAISDDLSKLTSK
ncbi:MAG: hypothetical protein HN509_13855 [Halobacteriovoraceae bacterium]|jgi:hypothetical protein|nr:hypothetical protein [Halobacteriovoraceae bacterium]MBT5094375.1 hypothetical protein [Halobacteriovoraceae bacterium]